MFIFLLFILSMLMSIYFTARSAFVTTGKVVAFAVVVLCCIAIHSAGFRTVHSFLASRHFLNLEYKAKLLSADGNYSGVESLRSGNIQTFVVFLACLSVLSGLPLFSVFFSIT